MAFLQFYLYLYEPGSSKYAFMDFKFVVKRPKGESERPVVHCFPKVVNDWKDHV